MKGAIPWRCNEFFYTFQYAFIFFDFGGKLDDKAVQKDGKLDRHCLGTADPGWLQRHCIFQLC